MLSGSASVLGGVVVEIKGDTTQFRSDVDSVKQFAARAEREIKIKVPVLLDTSRMISDLRSAMATAQSVVKPIVIPLITSGGGQRALPGPGAAAYSGGPIPINIPNAIGGGPPPLSAAPGGTAAGRGFFGNVGMDMRRLWDVGQTRIGPLAGVATIGGLNAAMSAAGSYFTNRGTMHDPAGLRAAKDQAATLGAFEGLPLAGNAVQLASAATGSRFAEAFMNISPAAMALNYGMKKVSGQNGPQFSVGRSFAQMIQDNVSDQEAGIAAGERVRQTTLRLPGQVAMARTGDPTVSIRQDGLEALNRIKSDRSAQLLTLQKTGGSTAGFIGETIRLTDQQQSITDSRVRDYQQARLSGITTERTRGAVAGMEMRSSSLAFAGDTLGALTEQRAASRVAMLDAQRDRLVGVKDPGQLRAIRGTSGEEQKAFDTQTGQLTADKKRELSADTSTAKASERAAELAKNREFYRADLELFDANEQAKISLLKGSAQKNAQTRYNAERGLMVAQHDQQIGRDTQSNVSAANVANLRATGQYRQADRAAFEARANDEIGRADSEHYMSTYMRLDAERKQLDREQGIGVANLKDSYATRRLSAAASGNGQDRLAGLYGTLQSQRTELRDANPADRADLISTQRAELQAIQHRGDLISGNTRAQEFDVRRMAGGNIPDQQLSIQRLILKAIQALNKPDAGTVVLQ